MASGDRFYELELRHRPAFWGDIGNLLKIEGLVVGGEGAQAVLMLPGNSLFDGKCAPPVMVLSAEEWSEWLRQSDQPEILMPDKAFHRKVRYEISGSTQQKVWVADGFKCMFCGAKMGKQQLTMDHFVALENGGANDASNLISACKKCNKDKGSQDTRVFCALRGYDYTALEEHLRTRKLP
jgi:hypothetical protein